MNRCSAFSPKSRQFWRMTFRDKTTMDAGYFLFSPPLPEFVVSVTTRVMTLVRERVREGGSRQNKQSPPRIIHKNLTIHLR